MKHDYTSLQVSSSVPPQRQGVMLLPIGTSRRSNHVVVTVTFAHTSVLTSSSSLTTQLTMFHHSFANPIDSWISTNGFVHWVNHDHLVIQVCRILTDPVRV